MPAPSAPTLPTDPSWWAIVAPGGMSGDMVLTCTDTLGPHGNECAIPACGIAGCPEAPALIVGVVDLMEGPVAIPISQGTIAWDRSEPGCENVVTTTDGAEPRSWEPGRVILSVPAASAARYAPEGTLVRSILAVDLDGDGADEWIVLGGTETGEVTGMVRDGAWVPLIEDVRVDVPQDATDRERFDAQIQAFNGDVVGLTDVGLDGDLELVISGEGFESWGYEVVEVGSTGWTSLGKAGCAH